MAFNAPGDLSAGLGDPYFDLALRQVDATRRHFCVSRPHTAHYFVFTDRNASAAPDRPDVTFIRKVPQGWPRDSDDRYAWFVEVRYSGPQQSGVRAVGAGAAPRSMVGKHLRENISVEVRG